jgi:hypothetical protein
MVRKSADLGPELRRGRRESMALIGKHGLRVVMLLASLRLAAFGCGGPEAFRGQLVEDGGAGTTGVGGNAAGGAGGDTTSSGAAGAAGFDAGLSGAAGLEDGGVSGLAGATGGSGSFGGQGGNVGPDGGTAGASSDGGREMDGGGAQGGAGGVDSGAGGAAGSGMAGTSGDAGMVVNYCDRTRWTSSASINGTTAPQGIDGDLTTRFTTGRPMQVGDYYQVDFTGAPSLTAVTLNNTQTSGSDYAVTYNLYSSPNGLNWTNFASGPGAMNSTTISFAKTSTRYIRVQVATASQNAGLYFSIGEFQVACSD